MSETLFSIFAAAGTYVQGPGALGAIGPHLARLGKRAVGVVDPVVRAQVEPALSAGCAAEGIAWRLEPFPGECTEAAVEALVGPKTKFPPAVCNIPAGAVVPMPT